MKPLGYYENVNEVLLNAVPETAKRVVDIGCGTGALLARLLERRPNVHVLGVECKQLKKEANVSRHIVHARIEELHPTYLNYTDCFIFGDVLEHLVDPLDTLIECRKHLNPGGCVLASIPNVQHWSMLLNVLNGTWFYQDSGLLDRDHLRFFSYLTMIKLFHDAGFNKIELIGTTSLCMPEELTEAVTNLLSFTSSPIGATQEHHIPATLDALDVFQYIVKVTNDN